ncbi:MAG: hypothetical protein HUU20_28765, partial [Pirellulales bacterium]|nr:hypothetical protein [Pirellulales bacterium]
ERGAGPKPALVAAREAGASSSPSGAAKAPESRAPAKSPAPTAQTGVSSLQPETLEGGLTGPPDVLEGLSLGSSEEENPSGLFAAIGVPHGLTNLEMATPALPGRTGPLIVDGEGAAPNTFSTLKAACATAASGDVIELRYNGRREESPIELPGLKITIRAGDGYQPLVAFQPKPTDIDPLRYPRSMFTLSGSRLTMINVAVELSVPRDLPADSWSLFEIGQAETVRLERCWLTIFNASSGRAAYHSDVAFLRLKANPAVATVLGDQARLARHVTVALVDCVARGEATLFQSEMMQSAEVSWKNGLLATTEWFLVANGGEESPQPSEAIQVDLEHLTAAVGRGLCQLNQGEFAPYQLPVEIRCADSILVGSGAAALVEQNGVGDVAGAQQRVSWDGYRNFYEGFTVFWAISPLNPSQRSEQMPFAAWESHWTPDREILPLRNLVGWKQLPAADKPVSAHTAADYTLDHSDQENPPLRWPTDGSAAGLAPERLPPAPPPVLSESPPGAVKPN